MAATVVIRLEKPVPGVEGEQAYAAFARNWDAINDAAQDLGLLSPFDFVSETPEEYAEMMKDVKEVEKELQSFDIDDIKNNSEFKDLMQQLGDDPSVQKLLESLQGAQSPEQILGQAFPEQSPGEEWYEPAEGVEFLEQLAAALKTSSGTFKQSDELQREVQEMTRTLEAAGQQGVKFYFALVG
jgi:hypothetical protein